VIILLEQESVTSSKKYFYFTWAGISYQ